MKQLLVIGALLVFATGFGAHAATLCLPGESVRRGCPTSPLNLPAGNQDLRPEASPRLRGDAPYRPQQNYFIPRGQPSGTTPHRYSIENKR